MPDDNLDVAGVKGKRRFDWLRLAPAFWLQNYPTNWEWDAKLNELLDRYEPTIAGAGYTVSLGNVEVWISNYPYSYGYPWDLRDMQILPAAATRKRLHDKIKEIKLREFRAILEEMK